MVVAAAAAGGGVGVVLLLLVVVAVAVAPPKVVRTWCAFHILTSETRFAPQRRALFQHLNAQKWREDVAF